MRPVQELLYALNARQNLKRVQSPHQGILLSDRSIITAYASHIDLIPEWFVNLAEPTLYPDLAIYIDVPPEVGFQRISERQTLFMEEDLDSLRLFDENYKRVFADRPRTLRDTTIAIVDGNRPIDLVARDIADIIDPWIKHNYEKGASRNGRKR